MTIDGMNIKTIENGLACIPKGVLIAVSDAKVVKVKHDSKYFQRFGPEVHFWDITVETTLGRVWFRTYSREQGEAIQKDDTISVEVLITKVGDVNPNFETRYLFGKLLTKALADVKIVKKNKNEPVPAVQVSGLIGV